MKKNPDTGSSGEGAVEDAHNFSRTRKIYRAKEPRIRERYACIAVSMCHRLIDPFLCKVLTRTNHGEANLVSVLKLTPKKHLRVNKAGSSNKKLLRSIQSTVPPIPVCLLRRSKLQSKSCQKCHHHLPPKINLKTSSEEK